MTGGARAFTIIEVLLTVAIVVVLVGLTTAVSTSLAAQAEIRQTENTLKLLDLSLQEWELAADRQLTWGPGPTFDIQPTFLPGGTPLEMILTVVLERTLRVESAREIFDRIDPEFVYTFEPGAAPPTWLGGGFDPLDYGRWTVLDAWGTPIYALHPGGPPQPGFAVDADGTERTVNEQYYGVARNRRVCFVSSGPDGEDGRRAAPTDSKLYQQSIDNLASYPLGDP